MKKGLAITFALFSLLLLFVLNACNNSSKKNGDNKADTLKPVRINTQKNTDPVATVKPAIINIVDTVAPKRIVIYMMDSAKAFDKIATKLGIIYGIKLAEVLKKNGIKADGAPMAWYKNQKAPYFFEAGIAVNKKPAKLPKNVFVREMKTEPVLMAHFYGPYNLLSQGYDALKERMKDQKKSGNGMPYEIYISDPVDAAGKPIDPYKIRTDIIFPEK
jgi:effector-binding domain-containing protein